jgi:O-antigen ligase
VTPHRNIGTSGTGIWRYGLFSIVALYSLSVLIFTLAKCSQGSLFFIFLLFLAALSAWYATRVTLFVFAGSIPLLSGLSLTASALPPGVLNSIFSTVYLSWFLRHVLIKKMDIKPITQAGFFIDVLSTVILLSLFSVLILYPFDQWKALIRSLGSLSQSHELYGIYASYIFLQGLFLFRLLEINESGKNTGQFFRLAFTLQAFTMVAFSGYQIFFGDAGWMDARFFKDRGLHWPLEDIHSYGSFLILLFSVFLFSIRGVSGGRKWVTGGMTILLGLFIVLSFSRISCLVLLLVLALYLGRFLNRKKAATIAVMVCVVCVGSLIIVPDNVRIPGTSYTIKHFKTTHTFMYRVFRWRVSLDMMGVSPLTGLGMGGHYRLYPYYSKDADLPDEWRTPAREGPENAHNYFIQFTSDVGIPTLILLFFILFLVFRQAFKAHPKTGDENSLKNGLMVGVGGYLVTCIPGHPLLLANQLFLFWFAVAGMNMIPGGTGLPGVGFLDSTKLRKIGVAVLGAVLLAGYLYKLNTFKEWRGYELGHYRSLPVSQGMTTFEDP